MIHFPDAVSAVVDGSHAELKRNGKQNWTFKEVNAKLKSTDSATAVAIEAPKNFLSEAVLKWEISKEQSSAILNDHWERTYGASSWHQSNESEILSWYFMEHAEHETNGFEVKKGTNTFCYWQLRDGYLMLTLDTRSGGGGVKLGDRELQAAGIVTMRSESSESVFEATKRFMRKMCP